MTIKQRTTPVAITTATGERTITVRRLAWKPAKEFFRELTKVLAALWGDRADDAAAKKSFFALLPQLVLDSEQLITLLLTGSTDLKPEELDQLDWGDVIALVHGALEVNADDEIKNSFAGVMGKLVGFVASTKTKPGAVSTPTSSTPATPPTT